MTNVSVAPHRLSEDSGYQIITEDPPAAVGSQRPDGERRLKRDLDDFTLSVVGKRSQSGSATSTLSSGGHNLPVAAAAAAANEDDGEYEPDEDGPATSHWKSDRSRRENRQWAAPPDGARNLKGEKQRQSRKNTSQETLNTTVTLAGTHP